MLQKIEIKFTMTQRVPGGFKPDAKYDQQETIILSLPVLDFSLQKLEEAALIEVQKLYPAVTTIWVADSYGVRLVEGNGGRGQFIWGQLVTSSHLQSRIGKKLCRHIAVISSSLHRRNDVLSRTILSPNQNEAESIMGNQAIKVNRTTQIKQGCGYGCPMVN